MWPSKYWHVRHRIWRSSCRWELTGFTPTSFVREYMQCKIQSIFSIVKNILSWLQPQSLSFSKLINQKCGLFYTILHKYIFSHMYFLFLNTFHLPYNMYLYILLYWITEGCFTFSIMTCRIIHISFYSRHIICILFPLALFFKEGTSYEVIGKWLQFRSSPISQLQLAFKSLAPIGI